LKGVDVGRCEDKAGTTQANFKKIKPVEKPSKIGLDTTQSIS
jgi:hypothetical protein